MGNDDQHKEKDDFYIGYLDRAPASYALKARTFVLFAALLVTGLSFLTIKFQKGFSTSTFELGQLSIIEGVLNMQPVPMLKIDNGKDQNGDPVYQTVLLIGFGKHGAEKTIAKMEGQNGKVINGRRIKIEGTLIYHDGKSLMELTRGEASLLEVGDALELESKRKSIGHFILSGEIADPKCYFGVMKPGEGKPHRSCAVRCISGGIPPILKVISKLGETNYLLLKGSKGEAINKKVLKFVGEPVQLSGQVESLDDWLIFKLDDENAVRRLGNALPGIIVPMCNSNSLAAKIKR